jgi:hypothetical protein
MATARFATRGRRVFAQINAAMGESPCDPAKM